MAVGGIEAPVNGITPSLPLIGLREILRGYSDEGSLFDDLALASSSPEALDWSSADIRRRARRVLLARICDLCISWPVSKERWIATLPISTAAEWSTVSFMASGVNWRETLRIHGWPSKQFERRVRRRSSDEMLFRLLGWLVMELEQLIVDVTVLAPDSAEFVERRVSALRNALGTVDVEPQEPDRLDIVALTGSGQPWTTVAGVASLIQRAKRDPEFVAYELLAPDIEVGDRLFHLACFGLVIRALTLHGSSVFWRRPISGTKPGAQIEVITRAGRAFDLWFEARAARTAYGLPESPYLKAVAGIEGAGAPIGADIMLAAKGEEVLLFECKWSLNPSYVARDGYHQAASYALDARGGIGTRIWSFVVGPDELVHTTSVSSDFDATLGVTLGSTSPLRMADVVAAFLANDLQILQ